MENNQGSYTQVVGEKERVLDVQHKWNQDDVGYFQLCRRPKSGYLDDSHSGEEEDEAYTSGSSPPDALHGKRSSM